jgi:hypothetical protein
MFLPWVQRVEPSRAGQTLPYALQVNSVEHFLNTIAPIIVYSLGHDLQYVIGGSARNQRIAPIYLRNAPCSTL